MLSFNDTANDTAPNHVSRFVYKYDERIERREYGSFRNDSSWQQTITTRKLTYYTSSEG